jgi:Tol biopolymer transport system component
VVLESDAGTFQTTANDGGFFGFSGVPSVPFALAFSQQVALPPSSGWIGDDGGAAILDFEDTIPQVTPLPDGGLKVFATAPMPAFTLFPGTRLISENGANTLATAGSGRFLEWTVTDPFGDPGSLYVLDLGGDQPLRALSQAAERLAVGPTGDDLAFIDASGAHPALTYVTLADAGPLQVVATNVTEFAFAGSGQVLFSTHLDGGVLNVQVFRAADGTTLDLGGARLGYALSPDGSEVALPAGASYLNAPLQVAFVDDGGLISTGLTTEDVGFSADGQWLASTSYLYPDDVLSILPAADPTTSVTVASDVGGFSFAPRGSFLVYSEAPPDGGSALTLVDAAQPGAPVVLSRAIDASADYRWSADGRYLAFLANVVHPSVGFAYGTLTLVDTSAPNSPTVLATDAESFAFSPDGSHLGFIATGGAGASNQALRVVACAAPSPVELAGGVGVYAFSPDGRFIVFEDAFNFGTFLSEVVLSSSDGVDHTTLGQVGNEVAALGVFSPDGTRMAYATYASPTQGYVLGVASLTTGLPTVTIASAVPDAIEAAFSPDGSEIAYVHGLDLSNPYATLGSAAVAASDGTGTPIELVAGAKHAPRWAAPSLLLYQAELDSASPYAFQAGVYAFAVPARSP